MQDTNSVNYKDSFELKTKTHVDDLVAISYCCLVEMQDNNITRNAGHEYLIMSINCQIISTLNLVVSKDSKICGLCCAIKSPWAYFIAHHSIWALLGLTGVIW